MAPPKKPWFRFYTEALGDRKLRRLAPETRWLFVACLGAARMSPKPGTLLVSEGERMLEEDIVDIACMTAGAVRRGLSSLLTAGLLDRDADGCLFVPKWHERQFESDVSTDRTRKHRSMERSITVPGTHQNTETDTEAEKERSSPDRLAGIDTPPTPPPAASAADDGFDEFWSQYPRRDGVKVGKAKAHIAWRRIPEAKRPDAMRALAAYVASGVTPKDAERWLRPGVWDEWLRDDVVTTTPTPAADTRTIRIRDGIREVFIPGAGWCKDAAPALEDFEL